MALPLPPGLVPAEVAFLCEMELVTIVPRQRLDPIHLLTADTPALRPPRRAQVPLWLALLLKRQRRANIVPPPWLHAESLQAILHYETKVDPATFSPPPPPHSSASRGGGVGAVGTASRPLEGLSPPFLPSSTASAPSAYLPYHWLEMAEMLLAHAPDDVVVSGAGEARALIKDLQEVRAAKMRGGVSEFGLDGGATGAIGLRGIGAIELAESRAFLVGVVDGVRVVGAGTEAARREDGDREDEDDGDGYRGAIQGDTAYEDEMDII